jgi:small subunit ribosomal protein S4
MKLFLKGARCESEKCALARRDYPPGQISFRRGKISSYGESMREKQKVKRHYGVMERQFRRYFHIASASKGNTGESLMTLFERRLDNVIFRVGWAASRSEARQMITHGHVNVGGRRSNTPGQLTSVGDEISVRPSSSGMKKISMKRLEEFRSRPRPSWLEFVEGEELKIRVASLPTRDDVSVPVREQLIVELLSR